jgi:hypothetical protein
MTEKLLQFIWKHRYFNQQNLELNTGEPVMIVYPGDENTHQGPDFINARIRIRDHFWIGSIELHLYSSGWSKHNHSEDENYRNVILHVVWKQDPLDMKRNIPELELYNRVPGLMLKMYKEWMARPAFIPCERSASRTDCRQWESWAAELLVMRLNRRMYGILNSLRENKFHWEEQMWRLVAANFGNPVNSSAFESIAKSIPFNLLSKHRQQQTQLEALFLGQANMLGKDFNDPYPALLRKEYLFLKNKYGLKEVYEPVHFLRMRPENFPSIRLSQLASLCIQSVSLFSWTLECVSVSSLRKKLMVKSSEYWNNHYVFEKSSCFREKIIGVRMCDNIIINSIIPLLYTYGKTIPDPDALRKSIRWLEEMPAEQNRLMEGWKQVGVSVKRASGSQALTELKKKYCDQRKCLECDVGKKLLSSAKTETAFS